MRLLKTTDNTFEDDLASVRAGLQAKDLLLESNDELGSVQRIVAQVHRDGDRALCELTSRFDSTELTPSQLRVDPSSLPLDGEGVDVELRAAIATAIDNVRRYQQHIKSYQHLAQVRDGIELKTRYRPLDRVGIYVPGGTAPLFSTLIMTAVPAQVAGVKQLVLASPPRYDGDIHPVILAVCGMLGIDEVYRVGGAQAIAAMALGTQTIRPVDKIVGPGNLYVQLAKKTLFGLVDIESLAGPSEITVLADETANPRFVAADLIGQAEHDRGSAFLVTASRELADRVARQIDDLLAKLPGAEQVRRSLDRSSAIILTVTLDEAIDQVNRLAPEHLSVQTDQPDAVAERCHLAGAIFVGAYTTEALGDYLAGPSHVLPTGGTARIFSPLNVMDFMRHSSVIKYDRSALRDAYSALKAMTTSEQLPGHLLSVTVRLED